MSEDEEMKIPVFLLTLTLSLIIISALVLAPPPGSCSPWPSCNDGDEEPPTDPPSSCPDTNVGTPAESLVLSTPDTLRVIQWNGNDYVEVASASVGVSTVTGLAIGNVMTCHPSTEIVLSGNTVSGKGKKKTSTPNIIVYAFDGVDITEIGSFNPGMPVWPVAIGQLYSGNVEQILVDSASTNGAGTQIAELWEHDGTSFNKVHEFTKNPISTSNFWTFIGDVTGTGVVAGIQLGDSSVPARGFELWEKQGSWTNVANIDAGGFVHDDGKLVDFDGDGVLDIATTGSAGELLIIEGGSYQEMFNYDLSASTTQSLAVGDFNGDGCQDVALATEGIGSDSETFTAAVFEGDCLGGFTRVNDLNSDFDDISIQISVMDSKDLDGDGFDEIFLFQYDWDTQDSILVVWKYNSGTDTYFLDGNRIIASGEGTSTVIESAVLP